MRLLTHLPKGLAERLDRMAADMGVPPIVVLYACVEFADNDETQGFAVRAEEVLRRLMKMPDGRLVVVDPPKQTSMNGHVLVKYDDAGSAWFVDRSGQWSDQLKCARLFLDEAAAADAKTRRSDWSSIWIERVYEGPWGPERRRL